MKKCSYMCPLGRLFTETLTCTTRTDLCALPRAVLRQKSIVHSEIHSESAENVTYSTFNLAAT